MRVSLLLPGLLLVVPVFGQISQPNNLSNAAARRQRDQESGRYQARQDSLERLFYQQPTYVVVSYYQNARRLPWSAAMQLFLQNENQKLTLQPTTDNRFLLPPLNGDSLRLVLNYRGRELRFRKMPTWYFAHGASVNFGRFNRTTFIKQFAGGWSPFREALHAMDSVSVMRCLRSKKVQCIQYRVTQPRVYGNGMVETVWAPLFR